MTKKTNTQSDLVKLKLAVIKFHQGNEYLEASMARDACFTSHNSVNYKKTGQNQMGDVATAIKTLMPQQGSAEIVDRDIERLLDRYERMEAELDILEARHAADKAVFKEITGEEWTARPKRTAVAAGPGESLGERLKKFAA